MPSELKTAVRLLTFRATSEELGGLNLKHLALGLLLTWLVGMGRWWEDPRAGMLQHLGIGSVVYVFVLAFFLWLILWPISPRQWSLTNVLAFIALTSPPAILYAIPVRHGLELQTAQTVRLLMLALVAGWRVALLVFYLRRTGFSPPKTFIASLFPLTLIIFTLTSLNLEKVVFDFMGGRRKEDGTVNDVAYQVLVMITMISALMFLPLLAAYLINSVQCVFVRFGRRAGVVIYVIAGIFAVLGAVLSYYEMPPLSFVFAGTGVVLAASAAFKMRAKEDHGAIKMKP